MVSGVSTWDVSSHRYGSVPVPVVPGYIADKSQAGQLEVTVATPNAEETVSYTPVGRIILVDEAGESNRWYRRYFRIPTLSRSDKGRANHSTNASNKL